MEGALCKRTDAALIDLSERIIRGGFAIAFGCGILIAFRKIRYPSNVDDVSCTNIILFACPKNVFGSNT